MSLSEYISEAVAGRKALKKNHYLEILPNHKIGDWIDILEKYGMGRESMQKSMTRVDTGKLSIYSWANGCTTIIFNLGGDYGKDFQIDFDTKGSPSECFVSNGHRDDWQATTWTKKDLKDALAIINSML